MADLRKGGMEPGQKVTVFNEELLTGIVNLVDYPNDSLQLTKAYSASGHCYKQKLILKISDCKYIQSADVETKEQQTVEVDECLFSAVQEDAETASADETAASTLEPANTETVRADKDVVTADKSVGASAADIGHCVAAAGSDDGTQVQSTAPDIKRLPPIARSARALVDEPMVKLIYGRDEWYSFALQDLRNHWVVSLLCADVVIHKTPAAVILLATSKYVYVFCLTKLRQREKPPTELQEFLEGLPTPYKICHNTQQTTEYLQRLGIKFKGTSDAFQLFCKITGNKQPLTLTEMLDKNYDLGTVLETEHPLEALTAQVTLQLKLFEHMLHQQMMASFEQPKGEFTMSDEPENPKKKYKQICS